MSQHTIPAEALMDLRRRLATLPPRSPERRRLMQETARLLWRLGTDALPRAAPAGQTRAL